MASYIVYLTTFLLAISAANALKCYQCSGPECNYGIFSFAYGEVDCNKKSGHGFLDGIGSLIPSQCVKIVGTASALKCYSCNGVTCGYGWLSWTYAEVECASTGNKFIDAVTSILPTQCVKIFGKDENGSNFIMRNCTAYTTETGCKLLATTMQLGTNLKEVECFTCTTDLCNSASKFGGMAIIGVILGCFIFLF